MNTTWMKARVPNIVMPVIAAAMMLGAARLPAQGAPTPPANPRNPETTPPPRVPRPPRGWSGGDGVARIDTVVPFSSNGTVELSLIAGSIKVATWDRNQVRIVATTSGPPSLQLDVSESHLSLEQVKNGYNNDRHDVGSATYDVTVPAGSRATLSAVSGNINAEGLHGSVEVSNVSGDVSVRDVGSSLSVEGVSGGITVANIAGDAHVENVSGDVSLTGVGGTANVETVSGDITVRGVRGSHVHGTTVSGNIDFAGTLNASGRYEFETHSGRATLRLASNSNGLISVNTFSGSVSNDYPGAVRRPNSDSDDDTTSRVYLVGRGEGRVRVETFSGSVHISQGNP